MLPGAMTVMESHDIALELQHKIEALEYVERAFVHVCSTLLSDDKCPTTFHMLDIYIYNFSRSKYVFVRLIIYAEMDWSIK